MSVAAVVAMFVILGFVWGGLGIILLTAIRRERAKAAGPFDGVGDADS